MSRMEYNKNPISLREGKIFIDGVEACDCVKCEIKFTPDVWTGRLLGETTQNSRWLGGTITGTITRRRSTPWLKEAIKNYLNGKSTPEFTIQGVMDDENSDYYADNGSETVTCVGCVLTGDLNLINLDSDGEIVDDSISFNAKDIV
ncbi:MAG: phage tail tube protein [Clostridiales bacterium]|nr:phage tail tube protein [Clostridiales bacterium]